MRASCYCQILDDMATKVDYDMIEAFYGEDEEKIEDKANDNKE